MDEKFQVFQFDDVRIEPAAFRVWKGGAAVALEPKAFEVLLFFIQNSGRVVTKRELLDAVWKDTFVSENALTREIALLRKALGEEARKAKYIETVPTRGYRFIAEIHHGVSRKSAHEETSAHIAPQVEIESRAATAPQAPLSSLTPTTNLIEGAAPRMNRRRSLWRFAVPFVAVILFTVAAGSLLWNLRDKTAGSDETIGVRRITQVTTSTALDFFLPSRLTAPMSLTARTVAGVLRFTSDNSLRAGARFRSLRTARSIFSPRGRPTDSASPITRESAAASGSCPRWAASRAGWPTSAQSPLGLAMANRSPSSRRRSTT